MPRRNYLTSNPYGSRGNLRRAARRRKRKYPSETRQGRRRRLLGADTRSANYYGGFDGRRIRG